MAPALNIDCINSVYPEAKIHVPLVPLHLYYVVFETIKVEVHNITYDTLINFAQLKYSNSD